MDTGNGQKDKSDDVTGQESNLLRILLSLKMPVVMSVLRVTRMTRMTQKCQKLFNNMSKVDF